MRLRLLFGCGHLSQNQITRFFYHHFLLKGSVDSFLNGIVIKARKYPRLPFLIELSQLCSSPNQIVGFFDQQYHWKEPINIFDLLHRDNNQGKVASQDCILG